MLNFGRVVTDGGRRSAAQHRQMQSCDLMGGVGPRARAGLTPPARTDVGAASTEAVSRPARWTSNRDSAALTSVRHRPSTLPPLGGSGTNAATSEEREVVAAASEPVLSAGSGTMPWSAPRWYGGVCGPSMEADVMDLGPA